MNTSLPSCSQPASLTELRNIEEYLAEMLASLHGSGRKSDSLFLRGLDELHEALSLGLAAIPVAPGEPRQAPTEMAIAPQAEVAHLEPPEELEIAEDELVLDFDDEIRCLQVNGELPPDFVPTRLRRKTRASQ